MNHLTLALQGYESLSQRLNTTLNEAVSDEAEAWLTNEVCPVVEELCRAGNFQRMTQWSLDHLCSENSTTERVHLQRFEDAFVQYVSALSAGIAVIDAASSNSSPSPISDEDRTQLEVFADRPWLLLASASDFFHPFNDLYLRESNDSLTADFRSQERRIPLGDYISRYLLARVEFWRKKVLQVGQRINAQFPDSGKPLPALSQIAPAQIRLNNASKLLRDVCNSGEVREREACAALIQVYAAYSSNPDLKWLGVSRDRLRSSIPQIRMCIRPPSNVRIVRQLSGGGLQPIRTETQLLCDPTVVRQIASALLNVATFYEVPEDPDDLIQWAADRTRLVLVDRAPRQVFLEGKLVGGNNWDNQSAAWNMLWALALRPGATIDRDDLGGSNARSRRSRLSKILFEHQELDKQIENIPGQGYRINLPPEQVTLLRDDGLGQLQFVDQSRASTL